MNAIIKTKNKLYTINSVPGIRTKFDIIETVDGKECRVFNPLRSKLASSIVKGLKNFAFEDNSNILYLGASHGYTVSFLSDICLNGNIFAIDFAPRVVRDLVMLSENRKNLVPILADARNISTFYSKVLPQFDIVYMDVAQKDQVEIFVKNVDTFLKPQGIAYLALKARAIDSTAKPDSVFKKVRQDLQNERSFKIIEELNLNPFQRDHIMFVIRKTSDS